jgi:uncharacterized membrane protein YgdD (TMEM256/DUF423 family)
MIENTPSISTVSSPEIARLERFAALLVFLSIALGAMGAHAFQAQLAATEHGLDNWRTAALYHGLHAVALFFLAQRQRPIAWWCIFWGILLFSGSLYLHAYTGNKWLVHITPLGGLLLMCGWLLLALRRMGRMARKS